MSNTPMVPVRFKGRLLYTYPSVLEGKEDGALAPPEHVTADGRLNNLCFVGESFGHVFVGVGILRHGKVIGMLSDLIPMSSVDGFEQ